LGKNEFVPSPSNIVELVKTIGTIAEHYYAFGAFVDDDKNRMH